LYTTDRTSLSMKNLTLLTLAFAFFFTVTATTDIYTLSLHDALPISARAYRPGHRALQGDQRFARPPGRRRAAQADCAPYARAWRSEEHTSELQSLAYLVCRLLLEKKNLRSPVARRAVR